MKHTFYLYGGRNKDSSWSGGQQLGQCNQQQQQKEKKEKKRKPKEKSHWNSSVPQLLQGRVSPPTQKEEVIDDDGPSVTTTLGVIDPTFLSLPCPWISSLLMACNQKTMKQRQPPQDSIHQLFELF